MWYLITTEVNCSHFPIKQTILLIFEIIDLFFDMLKESQMFLSHTRGERYQLCTCLKNDQQEPDEIEKSFAYV